MHLHELTSSTETLRTRCGDEGSRILDVEELMEWRYGDLGDLGISFFLCHFVGICYSTNGVGTGFTTSGNPVTWRWSFPVHQNVSLDGTAQSCD